MPSEGSGFWSEETHRVRIFCAGSLKGSGCCVSVRQRVRNFGTRTQGSGFLVRGSVGGFKISVPRRQRVQVFEELEHARFEFLGQKR